jgi:hypothetical protein
MDTTSPIPHLTISKYPIPKAVALATAARIEAIVPADELPLRHEDCLLLGVWRRLTDRRRLCSPSAWEACLDLLESGYRAPRRLGRGEAEAWLVTRDPMDLVWQLIAIRLSLALDEFDLDTDEREEYLAVIDGLIGAVANGRVHVAGALVDRLEDLGLVEFISRVAPGPNNNVA